MEEILTKDNITEWVAKFALYEIELEWEPTLLTTVQSLAAEEWVLNFEWF